MKKGTKKTIKILVIAIFTVLIISTLTEVMKETIANISTSSDNTVNMTVLIVVFGIIMVAATFTMFGLPIILIVWGVKSYRKRQHQETLEYMQAATRHEEIKLRQAEMELQKKKLEKWACPYCGTTNFKRNEETEYCCKNCGGTI